MNTKQLQYVLILAREGSFSKAADVLNISQPSLSQYIKKIEKEVGLDLFDRSSGDVRLTDAGRVYIEAGQKILNIEHQMENSFNDLSVFKTGSLIIGTTPFRAASIMPMIAKQFQVVHPGMHLVIRENTTSELPEGIERGEYDLALSLKPVEGKRFTIEKVLEEELLLAVPAHYDQFAAASLPDRKYPAIKAKEIDKRSFIRLTDTQFMQRQLDDLCLNYGLSIQTAAIVKSLEAQIEFVKAGVGMALVPSGIELFCKDDSVRFYSFEDPLPKREVVVMWRKDRRLSKAAEDLKTVIKTIKW